jgi:hypothetical protein
MIFGNHIAFGFAALTSGNVMSTYVTPIVVMMSGLAGILCTFFLVIAGVQYSTSTGNPEKLEHAKHTIRNAIIGLTMVLVATTLVAILKHAYRVSTPSTASSLPVLSSVRPVAVSNGLVDVLIKAITGLLNNIIQSAATPFLQALTYFTTSTPHISSNPEVFNLWLAMVGITDAVFVLVIALLGFHIMSYDTIGLEEIEFKHLLPQIGLIFLLINNSIFIIDGLISLSNALIRALQVGLNNTSVWDVLTLIVKQSTSFGLAALLIMIAFLILAVILLVYYVGRLVTLYLGAVLSPIVLLLWLLPSFREFSISAAKTYLVSIFVLFVHVVILLLAASLLSGLVSNTSSHTADPIMCLVVGLSTLLALLKTQGILTQFSYATIGVKSLRKLSGQFINGLSYANPQSRQA